MKKRIKCFTLNILFLVAMLLFIPSLNSSAAKAPSVSKKIPVYYQNTYLGKHSYLVEGSNLISIKNLNGGKISNVKVNNKKIQAKVFKGKYIALSVKDNIPFGMGMMYPLPEYNHTLKDRQTSKLTFTVTSKNKKKYNLSTQLVFKKIATPVSSLKINGVNRLSNIKTKWDVNNFNVGTSPIKIDVSLRKSYKIKSISLIYSDSFSGEDYAVKVKNGSTIEPYSLNGARVLESIKIVYSFSNAPKVTQPNYNRSGCESAITYYVNVPS